METLAAAAISLLAPYLAKGAEQFASEVGKEAAGAVRAIAERLQRWWSREPVAAAAAQSLPTDPSKYAPVLADLLAGDLAKDPGFAAELRELVDAASPHVDVVQRMEVATGVTGADIDELVRGSVRVEQVIRNARDVTGFRAKTVGRNPEQT
jgi:hypothetical protein